jgi:hypothetical protein
MRVGLIVGLGIVILLAGWQGLVAWRFPEGKLYRGRKALPCARSR